jgi:hypothetical protein
MSLDVFAATQTNAAPACVVPNYAAGAKFPNGTLPSSIAAADFNGDGKADWATTNFSANNISIFLGNGAGGVLSTTTLSASGNNPRNIATGDFNSNGKVDLAVVNAGSDSISIFPGNGSGGFAAPTNHFVGGNPNAIVVTDFNNDGKSDLAVANADTNNVSVLLGNGTGGFTALTPAVLAGFAPLGITAADLTGTE